MHEKFLKTHFYYGGAAVGFKCDEILLPNRHKAWREYLTHPGAASVIPFIDSPKKFSLHQCRIAMVQQYRYPVHQLTEEIPAGKLDKNESALNCLRRELKEETGYSTNKFHFLTSYWPTPAFSDEIIHIYWAENLKKGKSQPDDDEFLQVQIETFGNILKKIKKEKIRDSKTVIAILSFAEYCREQNWPI